MALASKEYCRLFLNYEVFQDDIKQHIDFDVYDLFCAVSTPSLAFWGMGPFRCAFRAQRDSTVYLIIQKDLFPGFDPYDYVKWINSAANCCIDVFRCDWDIFFQNSSIVWQNSAIEVIIVPSFQDHPTWDNFKLFHATVASDYPVCANW